MEDYFNSHLDEFNMTYKEYIEKYPEQELLLEKYNNYQVKILLRQTNYTENECKEMLKTHTIEECIKIFLEIPQKTEKERTFNQNIFRAIREYF